ncbi:ubiquitin-like domain-containing protein [Actinocrinis sp.]|uniref:ubiquitin-like domain-containing protein n=1 Tax=Actinocrinis sp. TaxID=1920516 RepID=UPI002C3071A0|nr:ubiquitin-like domain-containing protein [Actinocrinis sp.]HXR72441.1 ubiquitin-like domain-containing protein [Actinocrinis sp.]
MSGSRSTRGTGSGGPIQGASAWPSSFTGPARYSPPFNTGAADDQPTTHGEPYAPYADGAAEYADPYAADYEAQYRAESYGSGAHESDAYPATAYEGEPYNYGGADYSADYAAPDFPAPAYVGDDYPAHTGYPGYAAGYEGTDGYGEPEPERGHTRLLTKPRRPELDGPESDRDAEAGMAAFTPATDIDVPGQRQPEGLRTRGGAQRQPQSGRRKIGWAGRAVQGLVLAALLGGVTAYVAFEKTVTISVDGSTRQIHSFASTVGAALSSDNITTGSHDLVSPGPAAALSDNSTITVKYGRPITVSVNGAPEHVWVHAPTVGGAMQELGIRVQGARFVSVNPGTPISRSGRTFAVYTMRHVTFLVDGKTDQLDTTAATVQDAMGQAGITLANQDTASVPMASLPTEGETISILRVTGTTEVKEVAIPYTTSKQNDPSSYVGTTTVVTAGQNGVAKVTYALQIINGVKQSPKEISRVVTKQPVAEVEKVGTKALPSSASGLNWAALANCESGGNPHSVDPSGNYYGLYQFSISTWDSLGGSGLPSNASASEQTTRAELLYQRSGAGQWPVCGHFLFS